LRRLRRENSLGRGETDRAGQLARHLASRTPAGALARQPATAAADAGAPPAAGVPPVPVPTAPGADLPAAEAGTPLLHVLWLVGGEPGGSVEVYPDGRRVLVEDGRRKEADPLDADGLAAA